MTRRIVLLTVAALTLALIIFEPAAAAPNTRFKQWIAPLECVESHIADGQNTTVILTPKQCDDLLHPPSKPQPGKPDKPTPSAPDTGKFSDTWTTIVMTGILLTLGIGIAILAIHNSKVYKRTNLQEKRH